MARDTVLTPTPQILAISLIVTLSKVFPLLSLMCF